MAEGDTSMRSGSGTGQRKEGVKPDDDFLGADERE